MSRRFMVYYWIQQGEKGHSLCECMSAESKDDATHIVQRRLEMPSFAFDSEGEGRVIIRTAHVQYVEIEEGGCDTEEPLSREPDFFTS